MIKVVLHYCCYKDSDNEQGFQISLFYKVSTSFRGSVYNMSTENTTLLILNTLQVNPIHYIYRDLQLGSTICFNLDL